MNENHGLTSQYISRTNYNKSYKHSDSPFIISSSQYYTNVSTDQCNQYQDSGFKKYMEVKEKQKNKGHIQQLSRKLLISNLFQEVTSLKFPKNLKQLNSLKIFQKYYQLLENANSSYYGKFNTNSNYQTQLDNMEQMIMNCQTKLIAWNQHLIKFQLNLSEFQTFLKTKVLPAKIQIQQQISEKGSIKTNSSTIFDLAARNYNINIQCQIFIYSQDLNQESTQIFIKLLQQIIHQSMNLQSAKSRVLQVYSSILLFNYAMFCSTMFKKDEILELQYFYTLFSVSQDISSTSRKIQLLWKIIDNSSIVKRIFIQYVEMNKIERDKIDLIDQFSISNVCMIYVTQQQAFQIKQKVKLTVHFFQYVFQIINDLSAITNSALISSFNCSRFICLNLLSYYAIQSQLKIQQEIKRQTSMLYFAKFKYFQQNDNKFKASYKKIIEAMKISYKKVASYQNIDKTNESSNTKKLQKLYKQNPNLKILLKKVNQSKAQDLLFSKYNFQIVKQLFSQITYILVKQFTGRNVINRIIQSVLKNSKQQKFVEKYQRKLKQFLVYPLRQICQAKQFKSIFVQFSIPMYELFKTFCMIQSLPYYSFATQRQNWRRKTNRSYKRQNQLIQILKALDFNYIYQKSRFNREFLQKMDKKQDILTIIYKFQIKRYQCFAKFLTQQNKMVSIKNTDNGQNYADQKIIHRNYYSMFDKQQLETYFFKIFDQKSNIIDKNILDDFKFFNEIITRQYELIRNKVIQEQTNPSRNQTQLFDVLKY